MIDNMFEKMRHDILVQRYLLKDNVGNVVETEDEMFRRVAWAIAPAEKQYGMCEKDVATLQNDFYNIMKSGEFLPNSPTLMNALRVKDNTLSACFSEDTELLTRQGWKNRSVYGGEEVMTFNDKKRVLEFQKPVNYIDYFYEGDMVSIKTSPSSYIDALVTPNHDMLYKSSSDGDLLKSAADDDFWIKQVSHKRWLPVAFPHENVDGVSELTLDDCELLGWIITDGHICKDCMRGEHVHKMSGIIISQTNETVALERCLDSCGVRWSKSGFHYRINSELPNEKKGDKFYRKFFVDVDKHLRWDILFGLSKKQLEALWKGIVFGDGSKRFRLSVVIHQKDKLRREQIQLVALLLGKRALSSFVKERNAWALNVSNNSWARANYDSVNKVPYSGNVWDVQVPNGNVVSRRNEQIVLTGNCFVLPIPDSVEGIFDAVKNTALIQKAGGGTGFSFDELRPTGDIIASSGGTTSGPLSFMRVVSEATNAIQQGAFRRGANMGMMSINHPDILNFIYAKSQCDSFTNFNLSVKITDEFMRLLRTQPHAFHVVENFRTGKTYNLPSRLIPGSYGLQDLLSTDESSTAHLDILTVKDVWDIIVKSAWHRGDPGVCFIDRVNDDNFVSHIGRIESTNPCGEQPLLPFEACNLGSINVSKFVKDGKFDWKRFSTLIDLGVRFLDDVIDVSSFPLEEIRDIVRNNRRIGLGIMGYADALIKMGIMYDSPTAFSFATELGMFFAQRAHQASEDLADEKGVFPNWKGSEWQGHRCVRNAAITTIAPTGTVSIIAKCSSGIEPIFSVVFNRMTLGESVYPQLHPLFEKVAKDKGLIKDGSDYEQFKNWDKLDLPDWCSLFQTAYGVKPQSHVVIQSLFQNAVDSAVSKTVNLPSTATEEDVSKVYHLSYELGCKGITIYRDTSMENQILTQVKCDCG